MFDFFKKIKKVKQIEKNEEDLQREFQSELQKGLLFSQSLEFEFLQEYVLAKTSLLVDKLKVLNPVKNFEDTLKTQAQIECLECLVRDVQELSDYVKHNNEEEIANLGAQV